MNRRTFAKTAAAALSSVAGGVALGDDGPVPTTYYVDGYHGGIRGHMPLGSWRDILNAMRQFPSWKVSLDIEPETFGYLRQIDPEAFHEIGRYLDDTGPGARMEISGATYQQPFMWLFGGESMMRRTGWSPRSLLRGRPRSG